MFFATGAGYADALVAGPVASGNGGAVVLIPGKSPSSALVRALAEVRSLAPESVYIVGGNNAVTPSVERQVRNVFGDVTRVSGANRYATANSINELLPATAPQVWLASGADFPDALSAAAPAGLSGSPIYLSPQACIQPATLSAVDARAYGDLFVVGGEAALSKNVLDLVACT